MAYDCPVGGAHHLLTEMLIPVAAAAAVAIVEAVAVFILDRMQ